MFEQKNQKKKKQNDLKMQKLLIVNKQKYERKKNYRRSSQSFGVGDKIRHFYVDICEENNNEQQSSLLSEHLQLSKVSSNLKCSK